MTNKKNHKHETHEIKIEAEEMPEAENQPQGDVDALRRQLEEAESKLAESVEGWQRAQADFQNYRKRIERDNEMM